MLRHTGPAGRALALVLSIAGLSVLAGCYTVLKHPPTAEVADGGEMARDCYSCHGPAGPASPYDPLHTPGFDYYPDAWYGFYAYPWWWRDYWHNDIYGYGGAHGGGQAGLDDDEERRYLWGRGGSYAPPSMPPIFTAPPVAAPGGPGPGSGNSAPPPAESNQQEGRTMKGSGTGTGTGTGAPPPPPAPADDSKKKDDPTIGGRGQSSDGGGRSKKD